MKRGQNKLQWKTLVVAFNKCCRTCSPYPRARLVMGFPLKFIDPVKCHSFAWHGCKSMRIHLQTPCSHQKQSAARNTWRFTKTESRYITIAGQRPNTTVVYLSSHWMKVKNHACTTILVQKCLALRCSHNPPLWTTLSHHHWNMPLRLSCTQSFDDQ